MKKISMIFLSILTCLSLFIGNVAALGDSDKEKINNFKRIIEGSQYYLDYEDQIKKIFTEVVNENNQITVAYTLEETENSNKNLLFIGNESYEFEEVLIVETYENGASVQDLLRDIRTRAHLGWCSEQVCVKEEMRITWAPQSGCSYLIGQTCKPLTLIPYYGSITYILCRAGVFVACNYDHKVECTAWQTNEYECSVP